MTSGTSNQEDGSELYRSNNLLNKVDLQDFTHLLKEVPVQLGSIINDASNFDEGDAHLKKQSWDASDAEKGIVCSILIDPDAMEETIQFNLQPSDFVHPAHATLYAMMQELHSEGEPINTVTLIDKLTIRGKLASVGNVQTVAHYETILQSSALLSTYLKNVKEKSTLRALIRTSTNIIKLAQAPTKPVEDILDDAERLILQIRSEIVNHDTTSLPQLVKQTVKRLEELYNNKMSLTGISSGFKDFDHLTNGLQPGELIVIAARPSMGKTAFTLNIAAHVAMKSKIPVAFFSLEMGAEQLVHRLIGAEARLDLSRLRRGQIESNDFRQLIIAAGLIGESPLVIDETASLSIAEMRSKCRRLVNKKNVQLIIVDYLQLMTGPDGYENKAVEVAEISKGLKSIARELKVPVIALSQLNRSVESRTDKRPMMSDLRESGAIEQDADVIAFLYREEYYLRDKTPEDKIGIAEVIVAKNRNGPTGMLELRFSGQITRFLDLDRHHENFSE